MDTDMIWLVQSMWWGTVGLSYFVYGKRQDRFIAMSCGASLMFFPYFVGSNVWMFVIGVALCIIPWRWEI
jgi:hypothetical protein